MEIINNSDHIFTLAKATRAAAILNAGGDGFTYKVVALPNGMAQIAVYDELGEFVENW